MDPNLVDQWLGQLLDLSPREQAAAVLLAARQCEPIARRWFAAQKLGDAHQAYLDALARWQAGAASDADLEKAERPLGRRLNREIENEPDVVGAMAAHSVSYIMAVGLGYSPEAIEEMLRATVFFAAAAHAGSRDVPIEVDSNRLSPAELQFIEGWWAECVMAFPQLGD